MNVQESMKMYNAVEQGTSLSESSLAERSAYVTLLAVIAAQSDNSLAVEEIALVRKIARSLCVPEELIQDILESAMNYPGEVFTQLLDSIPDRATKLRLIDDAITLFIADSEFTQTEIEFLNSLMKAIPLVESDRIRITSRIQEEQMRLELASYINEMTTLFERKEVSINGLKERLKSEFPKLVWSYYEEQILSTESSCFSNLPEVVNSSLVYEKLIGELQKAVKRAVVYFLADVQNEIPYLQIEPCFECDTDILIAPLKFHWKPVRCDPMHFLLSLVPALRPAIMARIDEKSLDRLNAEFQRSVIAHQDVVRELFRHYHESAKSLIIYELDQYLLDMKKILDKKVQDKTEEFDKSVDIQVLGGTIKSCAALKETKEIDKHERDNPKENENSIEKQYSSFFDGILKVFKP